MLNKSVLLLMLACISVASPARAEGPISLGLFTPVQIVPETESVTALRLSLIYGQNADLSGLDLSLVGMNTGDVTGVAFTAVSLVDGNFQGWQNGWLVSITEGTMQGLQWGGYNQCGLGSQGVQVGLLNTADDFGGLQLGLVNITEVMRSGLQIGLVNIIKSKENLKVLPLVNWTF